MRRVRRLVTAVVAAAAVTGGAACSDGPRTETQVALWTLEGLEDEGRTVSIRWAGGSCIEWDRADVREEPDTVTITAYAKVRDRTRENKKCTVETQILQEKVKLAEPLGDRRLQGDCSVDDPQTSSKCVALQQFVRIPRPIGG